MDVNLNGNIDINITLLTIKVSSKAHTKFLSALEKHRSIMTGDDGKSLGYVHVYKCILLNNWIQVGSSDLNTVTVEVILSILDGASSSQ